MLTPAVISLLRCPVTGAPLQEAAAGDFPLRRADALRQFGQDDVEGVLFADGSGWAYAVVDGIPVLMATEAVSAPAAAQATAVSDFAFAGVYRDLRHYSAVARRSDEIDAAVADHGLDALARVRPPGFPEPPARWLAKREGVYDGAAELEAYRQLAPIEGTRVLQAGGRGTHAVKFVLAGAAEAWLLTPFLEEARFGQALAARCGVGDRFHAVVAIAEAPATAAGTFDAVYSPGSLHHTEVERALTGLIGLLASGGRFAAVDPWRAPGYGLGTALLGKRERDVGCRPLSARRLEAARRTFPALRVSQHGALSRYAMIALGKAGLRLPRDLVLRVSRADDSISKVVPGLGRFGSSVCLTYRRACGAAGEVSRQPATAHHQR